MLQMNIYICPKFKFKLVYKYYWTKRGELFRIYYFSVYLWIVFFFFWIYKYFLKKSKNKEEINNLNLTLKKRERERKLKFTIMCVFSKICHLEFDFVKNDASSYRLWKAFVFSIASSFFSLSLSLNFVRPY